MYLRKKSSIIKISIEVSNLDKNTDTVKAYSVYTNKYYVIKSQKTINGILLYFSIA